MKETHKDVSEMWVEAVRTPEATSGYPPTDLNSG